MQNVFYDTQNLARNYKGLFQKEKYDVYIKSGFEGLDEILNGLCRGGLYIVGGRPSMGKTAFALQTIENVAVKQNRPCLYFSMGMPATRIMKRLIRLKADVMNRVRGDYSDSEMYVIATAAEEISTSPLVIDDTPIQTFLSIKEKCRNYQNSGVQFDLIIIDYLQLMGVGSEKNRSEVITSYVYEFRSLARELDCPILLLSQIDRKVESRKDRHPLVKDLRDFDADYDMADSILLLYREGYYNIDRPYENGFDKMEIVICVNKLGCKGCVEVGFKASTGKIVNFEE